MSRPLALIALTTLLTGCSAPFIGAINIGGTELPTETAQTGSAEQPHECPPYHPIPASVKAFLKANNDSDKTLDPWASFLLTVRQFLEGGC